MYLIHTDMKVKLLKEIGVHTIGTIIDVCDTIVVNLERNGDAEKFVEEESDKAKQPENKAKK